MKKKFITIFSVFFLFPSMVFSTGGELIIQNLSNISLVVKVYPVGAVFNGDREYSLKSQHHHPINYDFYIVGGEKTLTVNDRQMKLEHDGTNDNAVVNGVIGYGKYKIDFEDVNQNLLNYCYVDFGDHDYPYSIPGFNADMDIHYENNGDITQWNNQSIPEDKTVKIWDQRARDPNGLKTQNKNGFLASHEFTNWPLNATQYGASKHIDYNKFSLGVKVDDSSITTINITSNQSIIFQEGTKFIADNSTFTTSSGTWKGISLTNSKGADIYNCTFNNIISGITIKNDNPAYSGYRISLEGCTINLNGSDRSNHALSIRNAFNLFIKDNTFSVTNPYESNGIFYVNNFSPHPVEAPSGAGSSGYDIKIIGNSLSNFDKSIVLHNNASAFPYVNILDNKFTGQYNSSTGNYSGPVLAATRVNGRVKNNETLNNNFQSGFFCLGNNLELYKNNIQSRSNSLGLGAGTIISLAPVQNSSGYYLWYGGRNQLMSLNQDNIVSLYNSSFFHTNYGYNNFYSGQGYHINASINVSVYNSRYNCWMPNGLPVYNFSPPVEFFYQPVSPECLFDHTTHSYLVNDLGDGMYDSILVTSYPGSDPAPEDEIIFAQAMELFDDANYYNSSNQYTSLIDNYMESEYRYSSLYDLYTCYDYMDTSSNPGISHGLWSELYAYLRDKILQYDGDNEFVDIAYTLAIMCEVNMQEYEDAISKYEGIILEHPDPVQRLLASWDYDALLELLDSLDGEGGSVKSDFNYEAGSKAFSANSYDDLKPVEKIIRESYRERRIEGSKKNEEKITAMLRNKPNNSKIIAEEMRKEGIKREIESRARMNMMQSKYLSREEKDKRLMEDIDLITQLMGGNVKGNESSNIIPQTYKLEQNYPNPFNPSTIISFSIPAASLVKLNVYDITGRLIKILSNDIREAGMHKATFDGSELSSGVYFYKIEARQTGSLTGSFIQTKRMVLIK